MFVLYVYLSCLSNPECYWMHLSVCVYNNYNVHVTKGKGYLSASCVNFETRSALINLFEDDFKYDRSLPVITWTLEGLVILYKRSRVWTNKEKMEM